MYNKIKRSIKFKIYRFFIKLTRNTEHDFNGPINNTIKPMTVITTLYTGDEQPDYKMYPTIDVTERWFDNFDRLLYERIKQVKNSI